MSEEYSREVLRRTVAQVCQLIGWHGIASTPLDVLVHCLEKYMLTLATKAHRYAEHYSRTEPNLDDLGLAFKDSDVRLCELREYCECVPPAPPQHRVPHFPLHKEPKLHFLRPGAAEVLTRPQHVHDHLPPMRPERELSPPVAKTVEISNEDDKTDVFKRPAAPSSPIAKRPKTRPEGEDCHARELSSVMMTVSGFLSPAREGKLPEARTPIVMPDAPPERVRPGEPPPFRPPIVEKERSDKKAKKSKVLNGKVEKPKKKEKAAKRPDRPVMPLPKGKTPPVDLFKNHSVDIHQMKRIPLLSASTAEAPVLQIKIKKEIIDDPPPEFIPPKIEPPIQQPPILFDREQEFADRLPIKIKVEKPDPEKLTSQPDKSKLNIFKKISTKAKDDKPHDSSHDRIVNDNGAIKIEKPVIREPIEQPRLFEPKPKTSNGSSFAVDLSSKKPNIEEPFDITKTKIKQEPLDDYPKDLSRPRLSVVPEKILTGAVSIEPTLSTAAEEKKERLKKKRKERKIKQDRVFDMLVKKQQDFQKTMNPESREPVNAIPPIFPFFPMGPGLIPGFGAGPGLIPGGNLFSNFMENSSALRGLLPQETNMLPNPFSMRGGVPNLINPNLLPTAPGLVPSTVANPRMTVNHGFGQPPRMPQPPNLPQFLRRPSLEVIPIEENEDRNKQKRPMVSPALVIKEKEKSKNNRLPPNTSFIPTMNTTVLNQNPSPKANPVITMPPIKPDVTIKLNSPVEKVKIEPKKEPIDIEEPPVQFIPKEKEKDKSEKKKDKLHKKEKKDKEQKIKKKKDKKDKLLKLEKKKEKLEKQELKDKLKKEKKEKRKEKEKALVTTAEGVVPKLTLKLGSSSPMLPPSPDTTKKLNIKPIVKKEEIAPSPLATVETEIKQPLFEENPSPELARISALVTRPPKSKSSSKHPVIKTEIDPESGLNGSPPGQSSGSSPARAKPLTKFKRIFFKPIPKRNSNDYDDSIIDLGGDETLTKEVPEKVPNIPIGAHFYKDPQGNKVWICPACGMPDNGTPMIGCDGCDGWYHWVCVGIHVAPGDSEDWYCTSCIAKRTAMATALAAGQTGKKRGRKPKSEKLKEIR